MKTFNIPLIEKTFDIYVGVKEWEKFKHDTVKEGANKYKDLPVPEMGSGRSWGGWIWMSTLKDRRLIVHELSHLIDDTMNDLHTDDSEFRAYITMWVIGNVLEWAKNGN